MAALSANPFDDLLSSHSVFVSPNMMHVGDTHSAAHRYGQHADDQYSSHAKDLHGNESVGSHNQSGRDARWSGQQDYPDEYREELFVDDPERELAHTTAQAHQHQQPAQGQGDDAAASPPEQLPEEDDGDGWEERKDGGAVVGSYRGGDNSFDADSSWQAPGFHRRPSPVNGLDDDDTTLVTHDDAPSPTAAVAATAAEPEPGPSSAWPSFEDQPIRGMVGGKEMSLDDLIAQGERQMQEAQAKTAAAKPSAAATSSRPKSPPATLVAASPPGATPGATASARRRSTINAPAESSHLNDQNGSRRGPTVRHSAEIGDTLRGVCLLYTSPSPRDRQKSRMPSSA